MVTKNTNCNTLSIGVKDLLYHLMHYKYNPFNKCDVHEMQKNVKKKQFDKNRNLYRSNNNKAYTLLKKEIEKEYNTRAKIKHEQLDNLYYRKQGMLQYQKEYVNSIEKEKELFFEYEKSNVSLVNCIIQNTSSNHILNPLKKDINNIERNKRVIRKYYIDVKNIEKIFLLPSHTRIGDMRINQVIHNSSVNKLNRLAHKKLSLHAHGETASLNIIKETAKIKSTMTLIDTLFICHKTGSIYLKKYYNDLKWNYVFLNRLCRENGLLKKRVLLETHRKHTRLDSILIDNIIERKYNTELLYRNKLYNIWIYMENRSSMLSHQTITNIGTAPIKSSYTDSFIHMCLILLQEHIKEGTKVRIVHNYMPYITMMSKQYLKSGYIADLSSLIQEGTIGIIEAIDRYQLGRGVRFLTYAYWWMHRYMIKVTIKKTKVIKLNTKTRAQKKIISHIGKLYATIQKKQNRKNKIAKKQLSAQESIKAIPVNENELLALCTKIRMLKDYKSFILCCMYMGLPPYKRHDIEQIAYIFEIPQNTVAYHLKKVRKYLINKINQGISPLISMCSTISHFFRIQ